MSRQMRANSAVNAGVSGSASAVGQCPAISSYVTRPSRKAPAVPSQSLKCPIRSSPTNCQSSSRPGPSKKPSSDSDIMKTSFRLLTVVLYVVDLRARQFPVQRLAVGDAAADEPRPGRDGDRRVDAFG